MDSDIGRSLPAPISSISVQKRNKKRYSIFIDDQYLIGVSENTLLSFNLRKGKTITLQIYHKLQKEENRHGIKKYLLKLLARRIHSRKELKDKALRKEYPPEIIGDILDELENKDYINDIEFARSFAQSKYKSKRWGPTKIISHLYRKGITGSTAEKYVEELFRDENLEETFIHLISKRKWRYEKEDNLLKRKKKIVRYLAQKGYRSSDIYGSIDKLMTLIEE